MVDYLLLDCEGPRSLCTKVFSCVFIFGIVLVMAYSVSEMLHRWRWVKVRKEWRKRRDLVPHSLWWTFWKEQTAGTLKKE